MTRMPISALVPEGLARSERIERPERRHRKAEGKGVTFGKLVSGNLTGRIGRLSPKEMLFIYRDILGCPVDFTRGGVNDFLDGIVFETSIKKVGCAHDIGLDEIERVNIGVRDGNEGSQMKNL